MSDIDNSFLNIQNPSEQSVADFGSRDKIKKEWSKGIPQKYVGELLHGNLHRHGFYFVECGEKIFYDGLFYTNKLEGYAQVFYNNGSNFQGLFKNNLRFGPGVLTYPGGEQDVGLWKGQYMIRTGSLDKDNWMPRLATTAMGQLKLLKYRVLVPVFPKHVDVAYDILEKLGANENILQQSHKLYNLEIENKRNLFFNKKFFDEQFYDEQDSHIDIVLSDDEDDRRNGDPEKEEQKEETSANFSDINIERVRQISEGLEIIEGKLKAIERDRAELQEKVVYCKACCKSEEQKEEVACPEEEEKPSEEEIPPWASHMATRVSFAADAPRIMIRPTSDEESEDINTDELFNEEETDFSYVDTDVLPQTETAGTSRIKNYLKETCICGEAMHIEDFHEMERELEAVMRDEQFFQSIRRNLKKKLEKHLREAQNNVKVRTRKILVNHVLSWNNEKYCVHMLKHSFHNRKTEYMVDFKVSDLIAGNRTLFGNPGLQEESSMNFLAACSRGDLTAIYKHIEKNDVGVNICDAKGNNGVFFAAINNHTNVVKTLMNLGAKLDQENDEGLLPLSMCLLIFLARMFRVKNWETAFLPNVEPTTELKEAHKWYPNTSMLTLVANKQKFVSKRISSKTHPASKVDETYLYLFDTAFVTPIEEKMMVTKSGYIVHKSTSSVQRVDPADLKATQDSIKALLKYGANPNAGGSPLPSLIISLFTEVYSLVEAMLEAGADVDVAIEDDITSLHIMASSKCNRTNVNICELLIAHHADPTLKTSTNHWPEQKIEILGKDTSPEDVVDLGKNPLHILCIRRDFPLDNCSFFRDMVTNFKNSGVDFGDRYLGHTPLSLAVLVGNQKLVEALMNLHVLDPHEALGYNMGNVLTVYVLKRYQDMIPPNAKEILDYLTESGANILAPVGEFENVVAFMESEMFKDKRGRKSIQIAKNAMLNDERKNYVFKKELKNYILQLGRGTIIKYIQLTAVENLYNLIEDNYTEHECVLTLAHFLTPDVTISSLQHLFQYGRIKPERFDKSICLKLMDIINTRSETDQNVSKPRKDSKKLKKGAKQIVIKISDYNLIFDTFDTKALPNEKSNLKLLPPGLDDTSKYKVCFHCLRKKDKLLVCPKCQLIYFCSNLCNKANLKLKNLHPCRIDFYDSESKRSASPGAFPGRENLAELYNRIEENCEKRRLEKFQKVAEVERRYFEKAGKSNTYGIKFLERHKKIKTPIKTPTTTALLGSVTNFSKSETLGSITNKSTKTYSESVRFDQSSSELVKDTAYEKRGKLNTIALLSEKKDDQKICKKKRDICNCEKCMTYERQGGQIKCKCPHDSDGKKCLKDIKIKEETETNVTVRKLRAIPEEYKEYVELLTEQFPGIDISSLILPYTCYSNGNIYNKVSNDDYYARMHRADPNYE